MPADTRNKTLAQRVESMEKEVTNFTSKMEETAQGVKELTDFVKAMFMAQAAAGHGTPMPDTVRTTHSHTVIGPETRALFPPQQVASSSAQPQQKLKAIEREEPTFNRTFIRPPCPVEEPPKNPPETDLNLLEQVGNQTYHDVPLPFDQRSIVSLPNDLEKANLERTRSWLLGEPLVFGTFGQQVMKRPKPKGAVRSEPEELFHGHRLGTPPPNPNPNRIQPLVPIEEEHEVVNHVRGEIRCFFCDGAGHVARFCPNRVRRRENPAQQLQRGPRQQQRAPHQQQQQRFHGPNQPFEEPNLPFDDGGGPVNINQLLRLWERSMNSDVHIDVPSFEGKLDPDKFLDWIDNIEKVFEYKNLTGIKCVRLVATKLRGYAQIWWNDCVKQRELKGKQPIESWEKMKKHLRLAFVPKTYERELHSRILHFKQKLMSVDDYTAEFLILCTRVGVAEHPEARLGRYIEGFQPRIRTELKLRKIDSLAMATEYAKQLEDYFNSLSETGQPSTIVTTPSVQRSTESTSVAFKCFVCGGFGHRAADCPKKQNRKVLVVENGERLDTDPIPEEIADPEVNQSLIAEFEAIGPETNGDPL